jgi:hypothetical protein
MAVAADASGEEARGGEVKPKRDDTSALGNIAAFLSGKKKPVFDERAQVILPALPASLKVTRAALCGTALQNRSCKHVAYRGGTAEYSTLGSAVHRSTPVTVGSAQYCSQSGCRLGRVDVGLRCWLWQHVGEMHAHAVTTTIDQTGQIGWAHRGRPGAAVDLPALLCTG